MPKEPPLPSLAKKEEQQRYLLALLGVPGVGTKMARSLIAYAGSAKNVFAQSEAQLLRIPEVGPKTATAIRSAKTLPAADAELAFAHKNNISILTFLDPDFPEGLNTEAHLPVLLFRKGPLNQNAQPAVAIVGSRAPSEYGKQQAIRFATHLARAGVNVVSGLAYGIDIEAHRAALAAGGLTTAVLGHGLNTIYPQRHSGTAKEIVKTGALISEYPSGTEPDPKNFPHRNRIIAGLVRAVVVVEATEKGGALITGRLGFAMNREVFALPGSVDSSTSAGCHALIQQQVARLVTDPAEVLAELDLMAGTATKPLYKAPPEPDLNPEERRIYRAIGREGKLLDELAAELNEPVSLLIAQLLALEFQGVVRQLPGRKFMWVGRNG